MESQSSKKIHKVFFSNQIFYTKKFLCLNFLLQESIHETKNSNFLFHGVTWCNQVKILKVALYIYLKYLFSLPLFFAF